MTKFGSSRPEAHRGRLPSASLDAQALLCEALGVERAHLLAHPEQLLTPEQAAQYEAYVARCAAGEPLAYILGRRAFYDREFVVTPAVLIPRPETELLLEEALHFVRDRPQAVVVDVGTGSGALAVTLAALCPQATVYATETSPGALAVARQNAEQYSVRVEFLLGDLLQPLIERGIKTDVVMANLPYVASGELDALPVVDYETVNAPTAARMALRDPALLPRRAGCSGGRSSAACFQAGAVELVRRALDLSVVAEGHAAGSHNRAVVEVLTRRASRLSDSERLAIKRVIVSGPTGLRGADQGRVHARRDCLIRGLKDSARLFEVIDDRQALPQFFVDANEEGKRRPRRFVPADDNHGAAGGQDQQRRLLRTAFHPGARVLKVQDHRT
jgi:HemK-like putative methylase